MEAPWSLPPNWVWARFRDLARVVTEPVNPSAYGDSPHIAPNHIEAGTGKLLEFSSIASDGVTSVKQRFHSGQILYSKIRPYLAKVALIDFDGVCSADVYPIKSFINSRYLHLFMLSPDFTEWVAKKQGRTVLPKINQKELTSIQVPVPPLDEQLRISTRLTELRNRIDTAKESLVEIPGLVQQHRELLLAAAFRGDLTSIWRNANPGVESATLLREAIRRDHRKYREELGAGRPQRPHDDDTWEEPSDSPPLDESDLPKLPAGWCWIAANEVVEPGADILYGILQAGPNLAEGIPYVRGVDIQDETLLVDQLWKTSPQIAQQYEKSSLRGSDILLGIIRATKVAIVPSGTADGMIAQGRTTARFRPSRVISPYFFASWLRSPVAQSWLKRRFRGIDMPGLNLRDIRRLPVPLAPMTEQLIIGDVVAGDLARVQSVLRSSSDALSMLSALSSSLLKQAFRGKLVKRTASEEPASALLDRIREELATFDKSRQSKRGDKGDKPVQRKRDALSELSDWLEVNRGSNFSFADLRSQISSDYDSLKEAVFTLLDDPNSGLEQFFDVSQKAMRLRVKVQ